MTDPSSSPDGCIFCAICAGAAPAEIVHSDEHSVAFMDVNPVTRGHALIVPRVHARDVFDISPEDAARLMTATVRVAHRIREALRPDGMNLIQASGEAAMQSVFHLHLHLIPRYVGDYLPLPFVRRPADRGELRELAQRIQSVPDPVDATFP